MSFKKFKNRGLIGSQKRNYLLLRFVVIIDTLMQLEQQGFVHLQSQIYSH